jgi:type IV pilus biogenesis protein CpaD/CtpE
MKFRASHLLLLVVLAAMAALISGCASTESDNASVRPWNSPEGWQGGALGGMQDMQHR